MKDFVVACMEALGRVGYEAAMLCRSVQVARPRESTSGGHSGSGSVAVEAEERREPPVAPAVVVLNARV
jgi:hypothetical protein